MQGWRPPAPCFYAAFGSKPSRGDFTRVLIPTATLAATDWERTLCCYIGDGLYCCRGFRACGRDQRTKPVLCSPPQRRNFLPEGIQKRKKRSIPTATVGPNQVRSCGAPVARRSDQVCSLPKGSPEGSKTPLVRESRGADGPSGRVQARSPCSPKAKSPRGSAEGAKPPRPLVTPRPGPSWLRLL